MLTPEERRKRNSEKQRKYRAKDPEGYLEKQRQWRAANREQFNEWSRKWTKNNKHKIKKYREDHKEQRAAYSKEYRLRERTKELTSKSERAIRAKRKADGLCYDCGKRPPLQGKEACLECNEQYRKSRVIKETRYLANGMCPQCGKNPLMEHLNPESSSWKFCETCFFKRFSLQNFGKTSLWEELKHLMESQRYKCSYTGEPLLLGVNASVDHRLPKSKYPELKNDLGNIQWVTTTVNRMKRDLLPEEFLAVVKAIHEYHLNQK